MVPSSVKIFPVYKLPHGEIQMTQKITRHEKWQPAKNVYKKVRTILPLGHDACSVKVARCKMRSIALLQLSRIPKWLATELGEADFLACHCKFQHSSGSSWPFSHDWWCDIFISRGWWKLQERGEGICSHKEAHFQFSAILLLSVLSHSQGRQFPVWIKSVSWGSA